VCDCQLPYDLIDCELGKHTITIKRSGFDDVSITTTLEKDKPQSWTPLMYPTGETPNVGNVLCETTPTGAEIWISGENKGVTPATIELPDGSAYITFKKTGYNDCAKTVAVVKDSTVTASCTLVAQQTVNCVVPEGASLYVDGNFIETTTVARLSMILKDLRSK